MQRAKEVPGRPMGTITNVLLALIFVATGCRTLPPLPPANLSEPGWKVRQGQAVWKSGRDKPEIAGELLLATKPDGNEFVQFTKTPFPLAISRQATNHWEVNFPTENKRYSGLGIPPKRLIWFWLADGLAGKLTPEKWLWRQDQNGWYLENRANGEWLEGYFTSNDTP